MCPSQYANAVASELNISLSEIGEILGITAIRPRTPISLELKERVVKALQDRAPNPAPNDPHNQRPRREEDSMAAPGADETGGDAGGDKTDSELLRQLVGKVDDLGNEVKDLRNSAPKSDSEKELDRIAAVAKATIKQGAKLIAKRDEQKQKAEDKEIQKEAEELASGITGVRIKGKGKKAQVIEIDDEDEDEDDKKAKKGKKKSDKEPKVIIVTPTELALKKELEAKSKELKKATKKKDKKKKKGKKAHWWSM